MKTPNWAEIEKAAKAVPQPFMVHDLAREMMKQSGGEYADYKLMKNRLSSWASNKKKMGILVKAADGYSFDKADSKPLPFTRPLNPTVKIEVPISWPMGLVSMTVRVNGALYEVRKVGGL